MGTWLNVARWLRDVDRWLLAPRLDGYVARCLGDDVTIWLHGHGADVEIAKRLDGKLDRWRDG